MIHLIREDRCDVLVAGAGLAGIMAAISAAQQGARVLLLSSGPIFSGSSFYPGTWGLGLIGPESPADEEDLIFTILQTGCGVADETMVRSFVTGITPAIARLRAMGLPLKQAQDGQQKDFIPCFDHKHRSWNGLLADSTRQVLSRRLQELSVELLPHCELLELSTEEGRVTGAVVKTQADHLTWLGCRALVLATGGFGGLYTNHLTGDEVCGMGQALALRHGCSLVNLEFMQMMPGYLSPCYQTIFNEKTFRYVQLTDDRQQDIFPEDFAAQVLLELRSTHGPFTSRLGSRSVDLAIAAHPEGVTVRYTALSQTPMPEFVRTYFDWLADTRHLTPDDPVRIGMFAHAANGGIQIKPDASTPVDGLYACGECTGGMHGADRIGGLSTANGLVFGLRAGEGAAAWAQCSPGGLQRTLPFPSLAMDDPALVRRTLQAQLTDAGLLLREERRLRQAIDCLDALRQAHPGRPSDDSAAIAQSHCVWAQLELARCILLAQLHRRESRGSHYRQDYPATDAALAKQIVIQRTGVLSAADFVDQRS